MARLQSAGLRVTAQAGRDAAESAELARAAVERGVHGLVVIGGDGMIHLSVQALAGSSTVLGVIPAGTGNDLARALGIPRNDPLAAADVVISGLQRTIDLGRTRSHWFSTVLCAGIDSRVAERVSGMRWPSGRLRYHLATLAELRDLRPRHYRLRLDDRADGGEVELEGLLVAVGNTSSYGGGQLICPNADPTDGKLDLVTADAMGLRELIPLFLQLQHGRHLGHPKITVYRVHSVRLEEGDVAAWADGERVGGLPLTVEAVPGALRVFAPDGAPA